jgi:SAM-dependent methyltransferase
MDPDGTLSGMKQDWNERARTDAEFFIAKTQDPKAFDASAADDLANLLEGIESSVTADARVLDLGCGIGRLIKPLAPRVAELHGVDVSGEMIERARTYLADIPNVTLSENNGSDLSGLKTGMFDVAYSYLMFQHIPDSDIVEMYLREVNRVLKPGAAFKFQIDGRGDRIFWRVYRALRGHSSWRGALWTESGIVEAVGRAGFDVVDVRVDPRQHGAMRYAYLWVTCTKRS